ncbi:MAG: hypothetical protein LUQ31_03075 [Methanoregula sp.]|nr:hypothetical protein [Methanoregula sp.]
MTRRNKRKRRTTVLDRIKRIQVGVTVPRTVHEVSPINTHLPGVSTETTEIGVARIGKNKALYLRLSLRSDH